jgi:hypothetical protein
MIRIAFGDLLQEYQSACWPISAISVGAASSTFESGSNPLRFLLFTFFGSSPSSFLVLSPPD